MSHNVGHRFNPFGLVDVLIVGSVSETTLGCQDGLPMSVFIGKTKSCLAKGRTICSIPFGKPVYGAKWIEDGRKIRVLSKDHCTYIDIECEPRMLLKNQSWLSCAL